MSLTKITLGTNIIEEVDGKIYVNGRDTDSGRYKGWLLAQSFFGGMILGAMAFAVTLCLIEYATKSFLN